MASRNQSNAGTGDVTLISATTGPFPPVSYGAVPAGWNSGGAVIPEFDVDLIAAGASGALTDVKLYGGKLVALVNADDTFTATHASELFTAASHGLLTGDGPFVVSNSGGALPAGLVAGTHYWIIYVSANTFQLAASFADAGEGAAVAITGDGTGTHTIADVADATKRIAWFLHGTLAASLSASAANEGVAMPRCLHNPQRIAYALRWTGTASNAVTGTASVVETA